MVLQKAERRPLLGLSGDYRGDKRNQEERTERIHSFSCQGNFSWELRWVM